MLKVEITSVHDDDGTGGDLEKDRDRTFQVQHVIDFDRILGLSESCPWEKRLAEVTSKIHSLVGVSWPKGDRMWRSDFPGW